MPVVTRFAPSPTGFLHIGGARTALFNWLFTHHHGGTFRLRIEDTDRARSTQAAIDAIFDGLRWLELDWDGEVVYQSARQARHAAAAQSLLDSGRAYRCWANPEELAAMREKAKAEGRSPRYDGMWRDRDPATAPAGLAPVIRFRAPTDGETIIRDLVQGEVRVANAELDDMVLLRADGTPTYMLSVVVDDHDMEITHAIRGDDHLTNAFRQTQLFLALGWTPPAYAHISLIHGSDGAKLSKRHGALGVGEYREMGFLPEAMRNYLLRLGWSHGDEEIISTDQAIEWFDLDHVGRAAARFDMDKLTSVNAHYIREADDTTLVALIVPRLEARGDCVLNEAGRARLVAAMSSLKPRARTLIELAENAAFYVRRRPLALDAKAEQLLTPEARARLGRLVPSLEAATDWTAPALEEAVRRFAENERAKLGDVAQPLRAALTGATASPGMFEVMEVLGRAETLARIGEIA